MDFKEFTTRAEQDIRAALEDASPGVGVGMNQVEKLQGESYTAITLTPEGTNIGMNLNLNQLYDRMQRGEDYDSILQAAVDQAKEHLSNMPRFDVAELSSYETAKDLLFVDVVGTKVNICAEKPFLKSWQEVLLHFGTSPYLDKDRKNKALRKGSLSALPVHVLLPPLHILPEY